jgi:hypothetical protein
MNEIQVLAEFRAAVAPPDPGTLAQARARVLDSAATGQDSRRAPGPRRPASWPKLALTGLAAAVTAAAVAVVAVALTASGGAPSHPGAVNLAAKELAYRVADAVAARPDVRPGQWVYWRERTFFWGAKSAGPAQQGTFQVWTTADSTRIAYLLNGKVTFLRCGQAGARSGCQSIGQPVPMTLPAGQGTLFQVTEKMPVSYAGLRSLPRNPGALDRYLASLPLPGWGPPPVREFELIKDLLITYVLPPAPIAELYRALGNIPGVTIDRHAVDVAGRSGIGFQVTLPRAMGGGIDQLILDPKSYDLMGQDELLAPSAGAAAGRVLSGTAILISALVSGPGIVP